MTSPSAPGDQRAPSSTRRLKLPHRSPIDSQPPPETSSPTAARHGPPMPHPTDDDDARDVMTHRHPNSSSATPTNVPSRLHNSANHTEQTRPLVDMGGLRIGQGGAQADSSSPSAEDTLQPALKTRTLARAQKALAADETSPGEAPSQKQLSEYREKLARDLERRELSARGLALGSAEKARVSPIPEESASGSPMLVPALATTSTESGNTVRGGMTPAAIAGTPSYPFPRMASGSFAPPFNMHRPFTALSPTGAPQSSQHVSFESLGAHDKVLSGNSTPASNLTFHPAGVPIGPENPDFPTPNLYELSLMLAGEPGLDAWWGTVVQIMKDVYKAERVTLAVPADTTDIENVPWGQKATYNEHQEDDLSLGYMARGSSAMRSSELDLSEGSTQTEEALKPNTPLRPGLLSRHSYTSYEENKERSHDKASNLSRRPTQLSRSRSYFPAPNAFTDAPENQAPLNRTALDQHDAAELEQQNIPSWEAPFTSPQQGQGRVLPVLQALDYEADPLIDHAGVMRVLDRGKIVALTRSYPYLSNSSPSDQPTGQKSSKSSSADASKRIKRTRSESMSKLSNIFSSSTGRGKTSHDKSKATISRLEDDAPRPPTPKYEEYEQAPPSPWSQSPAPSPAVRAEPKENPFFTDAMVDEESFNPDSAPTDYTSLRPPEAIGIDNSWTVLHIPLTHVLLSKPANHFRLDNTVIQQKSNARNRDDTAPGVKIASELGQQTPESTKKSKLAPIAILSVLSPIIPYPSNLRHSLEHLAPHLATTLSLCRHYTHLETELAGLQRRRPTTAGFGAMAPDGRPMDNASYMIAADIARQQSFPGSMTSPSDYSGVSKSATGSPSGTPIWESGSLSYMLDRRQPAASPAAIAQSGESYFSSKQRVASVRQDMPASGPQKSRPPSKDSSPSDKKSSRPSSLRVPHDLSDLEDVSSGERAAGALEEMAGKSLSARDSHSSAPHGLDEIAADRTIDKAGETTRADQAQHRHSHTLLHSYGADFASTFQSLPPSSSLVSRPPLASAPSRSGSLTTTAVDMPPPSDKLKGLMLDLLPAHVFVALPQTGEIVWVNSRYLSYRGQTVADLSVDPWGSIHHDDREEYLKAWSHSLRTGEQFSRTVRIRRFDGAYRWFYARAVASKDKRGVIMQFLGSYMDIHDQHIAELKAARQEEIEASEAKHRLLANLIPQIIFTATEEDGITFANEQWLSYTGQSFEDSLGLGFLDFVHPGDLAKCCIPTDHPPTPSGRKTRDADKKSYQESVSSEATSASTIQPVRSPFSQEHNIRGMHQALSRNNSSSSDEVYEMPTADLSELARKGVIKVATDTNGRLSYTTEVRLRSKTGEYRWHLIRCVEIDTIDFGSGASSYFGSATDINDHKILETKLKEAMESKSRFLSNMSHEIRTPLIGISGMVSFLQDTPLNEEQRDYTNTIQTSANSLIMIINDILDLSKVDAGMMKLKYEWFHTRSLIEDVNELVSTMAIAKRLELNYLVEADVPAWVKGDKVRIRQVLLNVIGNAIKFTSEGEVFSRCKVYTGSNIKCGDNEIILEFAIVDTGRGFTKEEADLIFKPFSQIDGSSTRQHGGSGLGLVISRQLVELHGGVMEGTAVPGKGSTFTFTARFALPTPDDRPNFVGSLASPVSTPSRQQSLDKLPRNIKSLPPPAYGSLANEVSSPSSHDLPFTSPEVMSTGSSNPSLQSSRSHASHTTDKSSVTSVHTGLARFSEAAKASGQDLSQMKLEMPSGRTSPGRMAGTEGSTGHRSPEDFRPRMYSILIICPQYHSREATTQHIEMTLPKDVPRQITALATVEEAQRFIGGDDPINFTHIVLNLSSATAIIDVIDQITKSQRMDKTTILVLCDSVQRQAVTKLAATGTSHERLLSDNLVTFIYKPVKPSRFAVIFDPNKMQDLSIDRNRSTAQQMVESQKASYQEIERRMGNKGYKVLLVEDNPVNQKVLTKYLNKIGVDVEIAVDGVECTDMVLSMPHKHYSLILCDLHMPRKDGYQACREIRQWERSTKSPPLPIIALSANVMSDVQDKCVAAGFSDYVTKPVDFIDLSRAMAKFF